MSKATSKHILEKGTELIFQQGYHSSGLKQILDLAGIPKGSFYYHFKSKEDFGLQVIDFYSNNSVAFLKTFLENEALPPKTRILELLRAMKPIYQEQDFNKGCLLGNCSLELAAHHDSFADAIAKHFDAWQELFTTTIRAGQQTGNIKTDSSAEEYAEFLLNSWEGALVRMKAVKNNQPLDLLINFIDQLL